MLRNGSIVTLLTGDTQQANTAPNTYAFGRSLNGVSAVVAMNNGSASNAASVPVGSLFSDGTQLQDAISGNTYSVSGGTVALTLPAISGVVLLPAPVNVDLTPPTATISTIPSANGYGWINASPVTVDLSASDSGSGVEQLRYWIDNGQVTSVTGSSASTQISGEGTNSVGLRALDNAGNISSLVTAPVNIDITPPVVTVTGVQQGAIYILGSVPTAGCNTTDALSGVATNATVSISGGNGQGEGHFTATCSGATDKAGNAAAPVSVGYDVVSDVSVSVGVSTLYRSTGYNTGTITVKNTSHANVYGPLQVVLTHLTQGVTLSNETGTYQGNPYITVPNVTTLGPGQSASVNVTFNNPGRVQVTFTPVTYSGQFN